MPRSKDGPRSMKTTAGRPSFSSCCHAPHSVPKANPNHHHHLLLRPRKARKTSRNRPHRRKNSKTWRWFSTPKKRPSTPTSTFAKKARLGRYGKRSERDNFQSGRHVRSVPGEPSRGRVAIEATLRQAAPHQPARRQKLLAKGQTPDRILLKKDDVRLKKLRQRTGALIVFIVDASGSMAANRMGQAKGAVVELLRQSYVNRDKVALIGCYGDESRVLLAPTQSVEAAKRQLETLPTGGATPLNDALRRAQALIEEVRRTGAYTEALVIVIGDGRGNIPARTPEPDGNLSRTDAIRRELEDMARVYAAGTIRLVVFDTQNRFVSRGEAKQLAELFGGRYIYLPRLSAAGITDAVKQELRRSS